jgi:hypothetical protein
MEIDSAVRAPQHEMPKAKKRPPMCHRRALVIRWNSFFDLEAEIHPHARNPRRFKIARVQKR